MFKLDNPFNIVFFAVTVALLAAFAVGIIVRLARKNRARKKTDVLFITLDILFMLVALAVGFLMLIVSYSVFGLSIADRSGGLAFLSGANTLFTIPSAGFLAAKLDALGIAGQVAPCALFLLSVLWLIIILIKTKRVKKKRGDAFSTVVNELQQDGRASVAVEDSLRGETPFGRQTEKELLPAGEKDEKETGPDSSNPETPSPDAETAETSLFGAKKILSEIDELVTLAGESAFNGQEDPVVSRARTVREELERAINEGLAFKDSYLGEDAAPPAAPAEMQNSAEPEKAEEETEADGQTGIQPHEETEKSAEETEDRTDPVETVGEEEEIPRGAGVWAYEEFEAEAVSRGVRSEIRPQIETPYEEAPEEPKPLDYNDILSHTRVRTIIRRPPATSVAEISRRAKEQISPQQKRTETVAAAKTTSKPQTVNDARTRETANSESSDKGKAQREERAATATEIRTVSPLETGLPLTKRYIILNRQSAANVFSDYLRQKESEEKDELTDALNTIILK